MLVDWQSYWGERKKDVIVIGSSRKVAAVDFRVTVDEEEASEGNVG